MFGLRMLVMIESCDSRYLNHLFIPRNPQDEIAIKVDGIIREL